MHDKPDMVFTENRGQQKALCVQMQLKNLASVVW